jgi:hypothetical protein
MCYIYLKCIHVHFYSFGLTWYNFETAYEYNVIYINYLIKIVWFFGFLKFSFIIVLGVHLTFTKVLTMYQIYHTWIHPLHHSSLSSSAHFWNSFNRSHFPIYIHLYIVFAPSSPPSPFPHFSPHNGTNTSTPRQNLLCLPVLWFCKRKTMICLFFEGNYTAS